jgi:hypothetical protein
MDHQQQYHGHKIPNNIGCIRNNTVTMCHIPYRGVMLLFLHIPNSLGKHWSLGLSIIVISALRIY